MLFLSQVKVAKLAPLSLPQLGDFANWLGDVVVVMLPNTAKTRRMLVLDTMPAAVHYRPSVGRITLSWESHNVPAMHD
jgi:hypothetical protein